MRKNFFLPNSFRPRSPSWLIIKLNLIITIVSQNWSSPSRDTILKWSVWWRDETRSHGGSVKSVSSLRNGPPWSIGPNGWIIMVHHLFGFGLNCRGTREIARARETLPAMVRGRGLGEKGDEKWGLNRECVTWRVDNLIRGVIAGVSSRRCAPLDLTKSAISQNSI